MNLLVVISPKLSRIMFWFLHYFWILPLCMGTVISVVETQPAATIYWHRNNSLFHQESGAKLTISIGSNLVIMCPQNDKEFYRIYWVSEEEFLTCKKLPDKNASILVNCNNYTLTQGFTQEISTFNGLPNSKFFAAGKNYYITTFSTGTHNGIGNTIYGACNNSTHNIYMKLNLTVVEEPALPTPGPSNQTTQKPTTHTPRPTPSTTRSTETSTRRTTPRRTTPRRTTFKPHPTDIPDPTDIVINVPDNGNTGVIVADAATSLTYSWALIPCMCLSILHILNNAHIPWMVR